MTPDQIHARRAHVLDQAALIGVTSACKAAGVSRTSYYKWVAKAEKYGLSALMPKDRRPPVMPNAMNAEEVSTILATAVAKATLGARQLVDHLAHAGVHRSASGIQNVLRRHNLGTRRQRVAALASLTAAESGQLTDAALEGPFGFCMTASDPGQLVCLDTFKVTGVLTDNGPEFTGRAFRDHVAEIGIAHHRIPPRSPNHNSVCERVEGTVLQEVYRPFFHRGRVDRISDLDGWRPGSPTTTPADATTATT